MQKSFLSTASGRLLLVAAACYLFTAGAYLLWDNLVAFGLGMPAGITVSFVAVGLGTREYIKETMMTVICMTPVLWGFMYLLGELHYRGAKSWGWGIMLLGALALGRAAMGGGEEAAAH